MANPIPGGWQEMKEITLPKNGDSVVTVVVNGVKYQVEAGKPTMVPYPVYERLTEMIEQDNIPPAKFPSGMVKLDKTLTEEGAAADAKAVGDALALPPSLTWDDLGRGEVETPIWSLTAEFISAGSQSFTNAEKEWVAVNVGQTYRVTYDGEKYDIVAKFSGGQYFGDPKLEQAYPEGLEYPFIIRFNRDKTTVQVLTTTPGMHTFTIATVEEGIIPVPEEYIPESIAGRVDTNRTTLARNIAFTTTEAGENVKLANCVFSVELGATYEVTFDGVKYVCVGMPVAVAPVIAIGSQSFLNTGTFADGEEPFAYADETLIVRDIGDHTISIEKVAAKLKASLAPDGNMAREVTKTIEFASADVTQKPKATTYLDIYDSPLAGMISTEEGQVYTINVGSTGEVTHNTGSYKGMGYNEYVEMTCTGFVSAASGDRWEFSLKNPVDVLFNSYGQAVWKISKISLFDGGAVRLHFSGSHPQPTNGAALNGQVMLNVSLVKQGTQVAYTRLALWAHGTPAPVRYYIYVDPNGELITELAD